MPQTLIPKILNPLPNFDRANSRKQFVSTLKGLKHLEARECDFIIEIRTDQLLPRSVFQEIRNVLGSKPSSTRILLSDFVPGANFYAGEFVFAGSARVVRSFVGSFLCFGPIDLHPSIGVDYVLKFLCTNDPRYEEYINPFVPAGIQIADPRKYQLFEAWDLVRQDRFRILIRKSFNSTGWRGQKVSEVINNAGFGFDQDNFAPTQHLSTRSSTLGDLLTLWEVLRKERRVFRAGQGTTPLERQFVGLSQETTIERFLSSEHSNLD